MMSLVILCHCGSDDESGCTDHLLTEVKIGDGGYTLYYNDQGLLSTLETPLDDVIMHYDLEYNSSGQLTRVTGSNPPAEFSYGEDGKLIKITDYKADLAIDLQYTYEYDDSGRLIKINVFGSDMDELLSFRIISYPDSETLAISTYSVIDAENSELATTMIYTMDNKLRPYPDEWYLVIASWGQDVLPYNFTQSELFVDGSLLFSESNTYTYNSAGYPVTQNDIQYIYACDPPAR
ncbi:MAG TPA: hypothetical protein VGK59_16105 [Ohtaekwangia sp.]